MKNMGFIGINVSLFWSLRGATCVTVADFSRTSRQRHVRKDQRIWRKDQRELTMQDIVILHS